MNSWPGTVPCTKPTPPLPPCSVPRGTTHRQAGPGAGVEAVEHGPTKSPGPPLTLIEKGEWLPHYTQHQQQQTQRRQHLAARDAQLDQLVYALYGLSAAEIALVEGREVAASS